MNIGFITENYFPRLGGMEFGSYQLAIALNKIPGVNVCVACSNMPEIPISFEYPHPVYRSKKLWYLTPYLQKRNHAQMIKNENINILQGFMLNRGGSEAVRLKFKQKLPAVVYSRGSDVQVVPEIGYGECLSSDARNIVKDVLEKADHIIALSTINKQNLLDLGGNEKNISIVHNGLNYDAITKTKKKNIRPLYGIKDDDFVIIVVGRNRPVKRLHLLFEALTILSGSTKHIKCLVVGPEKEILNQIKDFHLQNTVIPTGKIPSDNRNLLRLPNEELIHYYMSSDLYISTSYVESFGIAAAEALACGIPVIVGNKHGVTDIIKDEKTGFIMRKETPQELAELILNVYHSREKFTAEESRISNSVSHLTWEYVAKKMLKVYEQVS
jgi:glycosyltransferase involved in cell wall biosynthesis